MAHAVVEGTVAIRGLAELQGAFRSVDRDIPKQLRLAMKAIADHVVGVAQQKMPWQTGEAERSLRPRSSATGAGIARPAGGTPWRGEPADYYPWLDFGGTTGRGHQTRGHNGGGGSIVRPIVKGGRYLYPAIAQSSKFIAEQAEGAVVKVAKDNQFEAR
jgi:hypothetical protein